MDENGGYEEFIAVSAEIPVETPEKVAEIERMRKTSGEWGSDDPLVAFLYLLGRDSLSLGAIEHLLDASTLSSTQKVFTNGWLAQWAMDARDRLRKAWPQ